jgi:hypothetical protein
MKSPTEKQPTDRQLLLEIRDLLKAQQLTIQEHPAHPRFGKRYLKYLASVSVIAIIVGGFGAYQYYRILQSIIDQFPQ